MSLLVQLQWLVLIQLLEIIVLAVFQLFSTFVIVTAPPPESSSGISRRESRSRSPFPHLLKLRGSKSSKEPEVKSPPLTSPDDKAPSLGKRRFSKRFRKRSSKSFPGESSDCTHKPILPECEPNSSAPSFQHSVAINKVDQTLNPSSHPELTYPNPSNQVEDSHESVPLPNHSDVPEPLSPKKVKNNEQHAQRRRSVRVIRRAIDRLFTPKQKHSPATELSDKKTSPVDPIHPIPTSSFIPDRHTPNQFEVNATSRQQLNSDLNCQIHSTTSTTPPVEDQITMAEVLHPPQDVAPAPKEPACLDQTDDVTVEESSDTQQLSEPVVS